MPTQIQIDATLKGLGWVGKPADRIINHGPRTLADVDDKAQLWRFLNENVYHYARQNGWAWTAEVGNNGTPQATYITPNATAIPGQGTLGIPLLDGSNQQLSCNCGIFNAAVRQLAWHVLGFTTHQVSAASTRKSFVTRANTRTFDPAWVGNVRTLTNQFHELGAFKFDTHSFSQGPGGRLADATCNQVEFGADTDLMWLELTKPTVAQAPPSWGAVAGWRRGGWLKVSQVHDPNGPAPLGNQPWYLIRADQLKLKRQDFKTHNPTLFSIIEAIPDNSGTNNGWPNWWLIGSAELPPNLRHAMTLLFP